MWRWLKNPQALPNTGVCWVSFFRLRTQTFFSVFQAATCASQRLLFVRLDVYGRPCKLWRQVGAEVARPRKAKITWSLHFYGWNINDPSSQSFVVKKVFYSALVSDPNPKGRLFSFESCLTEEQQAGKRVICPARRGWAQKQPIRPLPWKKPSSTMGGRRQSGRTKT